MRRYLIFCTILALSSLAWGAKPAAPATDLARELEREKAFYPRLYLDSYNPIINNQIELYKLNKGLYRYKSKPWEIPAFAPENKETIDFANQKVILSLKVGEYDIAQKVPLSFDRYFTNLQKKSFRKSLITNVKTQTQTTQVSSSGLIKDINVLPDIAIPKAVQRVIGSTAGRLNLDGTQKISLSASNTKRKQVPIYETGGNNTFDLKMEQESNLRLSGTIGEKIAINFKYNSKQDEQIFDVNNVNVKYTGTEDELIKSIEGGNITLSLAGSRYVSYSASSQGLFGITTKFKYGNLDLSMIASKEESQKNTQSYVGKSQADSSSVTSWKYAKRTMYYLADPYLLYQRITGGDVPPGWIDNAIDTNADGSWKINDGNLLPANGTVQLYLDHPNYNTDATSQQGVEVYYPDSAEHYTPYYILLTEGTDYVTDYKSGIVYILRQVDRNSGVGVRYTNKADQAVPTPQPGDATSGLLRVKLLRKRNQEYEPYVFGESDSLKTWHYQMRNVYDMGKTNIRSDGFNLQVYTVNVDLTRNYNLPDNISLTAPGFITYNDYLRMDSNGDGLINGDDTTVNLTSGWITMPFIEPMKPLGDRIIYQVDNDYEYSYQDSTKILIGIKGKIGRDAIELSAAGILKGSVKVKVNGNEQRENVDYIVDYDFGRLTFLTAAGKDPDARIEIEFESRTLFSVAQKNLAGVRADYKFSQTAKMGGTLIYRSENVADKRPRIGNENIEMIMGNVDGELSFKPGFVTKWLDATPFISTNAPSTFSISGEVAFTLPNIYGNPDGKKKEAYIDDMESIMDSYPLGVTYSTWVLGSKPYATSYAKGRINWFNAKDIKRMELEDIDTLTEREREEYASVMTMIATPNPIQIPGSITRSWAGIMKYLGNQLDFSQKKYLEVDVKIDSINGVDNANPNITMHLDLGDINEDYYTEYGGMGYLNSEDTNKDGVLTLSEDLGLDGIATGESGSDPNDVADSPTGNTYEHYAKVNGTEGNRVLDTEDLDGNGTLNSLDRYISYSIPLNNPDPSILVDTRGNWKLIRIPMNDPTYYTLTNSAGNNIQASLNKISFARIWLDTDSTEPVMVRIADISAIGNKWQDNGIRQFKFGPAPSPSYVQNYNPVIDPAILSQYNTSYISGIVSNQKNSGHYTSPKNTVFIEDKRETTESALSMEISNLHRDHMGMLRQRMLDPYNLLSYDKIRFWVYPEASRDPVYTPANPNLDSLYIIFRIGADSLNYYQVRQRVPVRAYEDKMLESNWLELEYDLQELISLKEQNPNAEVDSLVHFISGDEDQRAYYYRGKPTLTNIRDMYIGVYVPGTYFYDAEPEIDKFSGTVYFDDVRVADPYEAMGVAKRISLSSTFADFATLNVDLEDKSENFNTVIQRGRQNTFTSTRSLNITNKYFVNKFFPNSWSLDIPISLARNYSLGTPRFRANSDLLRENIVKDEYRELEQTERLAYSADFGFSQKTAPKSKILLYTIYRSSLSGRIEKSYNYSSTAVDTLLAYRGTLNYNLNIPAEKTSFKLFKNYRLAYFPNTFSNSATFSANEPKSWDRVTTVDSLLWNKRTQTADTRGITTDNNVSWNLLSDITLTGRLNTKRDLKQRDSLFVFNIGKMYEYVQDLGLNYNPVYFPSIYNFTSSTSARYSDMQRKYYQNVDGQQVEVYQRDGNSNRSVRLNLTLLNSTILGSWAQKLKSKTPAKVDKPKDGEPKEGYKPPDDIDTDKQKLDDEQKRLDQIKLDEEQRKNNQQYLDEEQKKMEQQKLEELEKLNEGEQTDPDIEMDKETGEVFAEVEIDQEKDAIIDSTGTVSPPKAPKVKKPPINPVATIVGLLSRVKNINAAFQNSYTMNYANKKDPLPFAFQIGLPIFSVIEDSLVGISNDNTLTLGSGVTISRKLDSVVNFSYSDNRRDASASNQTKAITFPDITLSLMEFESLVGLGKYITGSRLNTGFQYTVRQSGNLYYTKPTQETITTALNPLIGFTGNLFKVVTTNLSYSVSHSINTTDMETFDIVKTQDSQSMNGNVSYSFRAGKGFTIPFTKKKIHIKNEMTSSLGFSYENNFDETKGSSRPVVDRNSSRFSITPQASYQFDNNIRGGITSSFEVNSDKKREDGTSIFSLGMWVEVTL